MCATGVQQACLGEADVQRHLLLRVLQHLLDGGDSLDAALGRLRQHLAVDGARCAQVVRVLGDKCLEGRPAIRLPCRSTTQLSPVRRPAIVRAMLLEACQDVPCSGLVRLDLRLQEVATPWEGGVAEPTDERKVELLKTHDASSTQIQCALTNVARPYIAVTSSRQRMHLCTVWRTLTRA